MIDPTMYERYTFCKQNLPDMQWFLNLYPGIGRDVLDHLESTRMGNISSSPAIPSGVWMHFQDIPIGAAFMLDGTPLRKCSEYQGVDATGEILHTYSPAMQYVYVITRSD